jgi:energy-converting hydrogenase A subunit M
MALSNSKETAMNQEIDNFLGGIHPISKKPYPVMKADMVTGITKQLTFADCKKVIRQYLKAIDFEAAYGLSNEIESIHERMVENESFQTCGVSDWKQLITTHRACLLMLQKDLSSCKNATERASIKEESR